MASAQSLQAQLDALDAAIAGGYLRVTYAGRSIEYVNTDLLLKARSHVSKLLSDAGGPTPIRSYRFVADKAL